LGLASLAELQILKKLQKKYPQLKVCTEDPQGPRRKQLRDRGLPLYDSVPIREAVEKTRAYIINTHRQKKGLPPILPK
ncbi:MAG: hypothetical protein HY917_02605, partial [Candidatus Diapherotrites archaeon]|nr:hypothetical protein [Candidatus Diapherotrites archaeon]